MTSFDDHEARGRAWRRQVEDNAGKFAQAYGFATTTGAGEVEVEDVIDFGAAFVQKPSVAYGYGLSDESPKLEDGVFPKSWGGVSKWVRDKDDFYIGAYVFIVVEMGSLFSAVEDPGYELEHFFTFSSMGLKLLPLELFEE